MHHSVILVPTLETLFLHAFAKVGSWKVSSKNQDASFEKAHTPTPTPLTLHNHWENHRGRQTTNTVQRQIKVGSILNVSTDINKEHPEQSKHI